MKTFIVGLLVGLIFVGCASTETSEQVSHDFDGYYVLNYYRAGASNNEKHELDFFIVNSHASFKVENSEQQRFAVDISVDPRGKLRISATMNENNSVNANGQISPRGKIKGTYVFSFNESKVDGKFIGYRVKKSKNRSTQAKMAKAGSMLSLFSFLQNAKTP